MSNQLQKQQSEVKSLIQSERFQKELAASMPQHLTPERFARIAVTAITRNPKIAECTQASLFRCLLDLSAAGLEPDGRRAYLIPYGKECTLIISYMGLIELMRNSGEITSIRAETVCENDEFSWENGAISHRVDWRNPRGTVQCAYAEAKLKSGEVQTATMTAEEIEGIRKRSKAGNSGPWQSDWGEMAKKTVVRRLSKMLPLSPEVAENIDKVDRPLKDANIPTESVFDSFTPAAKQAEEMEPGKESPKQEKQAEPMASEDQIEAIKQKILDKGLTQSKVLDDHGFEKFAQVTAKGAFRILETLTEGGAK